MDRDFVDRLKDRVVLSELIGKKIHLRRSGVNNMVGLCPFHQEKTPSFSVNDMLGFYHCFGCGAHGDAISFLTETERMGFVEAVELLANSNGMEVPKKEFNPEELRVYREKKSRQELILQFFEEVTNLFHQDLISQSHPIARKAFNYLLERGISEETIRGFNMGFCLQESYVRIENLARKYNLTNQELGKLSIAYENGRLFFQNRIIIPITNDKGQIIAFGGRSLEKEHMPKYLNSGEHELFIKNEILFNYKSAREALLGANKSANQINSILVVEGYLDVISLHQHGFTTAVAPLGTAVNSKHFDKIAKISDKIIVCFDNDLAGHNAAVKFSKIALEKLKPDHDIKFLKQTSTKDVDELLQKQGAASLHRMLVNSTNLSHFIWNACVQKFTNNDEESLASDPHKIAGLEKEVFNFTNEIKDKTLQKNYQNYFRSKIWQINSANYRSRKGAEGSAAASEIIYKEDEISKIDEFELGFLSFCVTFPHLLQNEELQEKFIIELINEDISDIISLLSIEAGEEFGTLNAIQKNLFSKAKMVSKERYRPTMAAELQKLLYIKFYYGHKKLMIKSQLENSKPVAIVSLKKEEMEIAKKLLEIDQTIAEM